MNSNGNTKSNPKTFLGKGEAGPEQTELSAQFKPDGWNVAYARRHGLDPNWETPFFMDFHGSVGTEASNWQAMFHHWLVKAAADHGRIRLPAWVPAKEWESFLEVRQSIGKTIRPSVQRWLLAKLAELRAQGCDPKKVLEQSILGSYAGLYEPNR